ncbi:MAG: serine hydrolase domain-containing protein [Pseudomonadota bacterium]
MQDHFHKTINGYKTLGVLAALLITGACTHSAAPPAQPAPPPERAARSFDAAGLDQMLAGVVADGTHVGVSALVFDEGEVVYRGAAGFADRERGVPMAQDTVVRIYSMTKTVTSAIAMDLVEDGLLGLDDPVTDFVPSLGRMQVLSVGEDGAVTLSPQQAPMTIKDLLLHRAGMGYGIFGPINPVEELYSAANLFDPAETGAEKMERLSTLPLVAQPGTGWYYSVATDVLGHVIETVTGQRLGAVMANRLFEPCGMNETGFHVRDDQRARFASTYFLNEDGSITLAEDGQASPFLTDNAYQSGGGGLVSTLDDYGIFAGMLLNGGLCGNIRVLETATVEAMLSNQMDPDDVYLFPWLGGDTNNGFGYGGAVVIAETPEQVAFNGQALGHYGWNGAARTTYWVDRRNGAVAILFLQYFGGEDPVLFRDFRKFVLEQTKNEPQ